MAIIGLVLTPIFAIQLGAFRGSTRSSKMLSRIFAAKKLLVEQEFALAPDAQEASSEKKITKPPTTLKYELKKIPENSALKKFKGVLQQTVTMQWIDDRGKKRQESLVTYLFKPEQKK